MPITEQELARWVALHACKYTGRSVILRASVDGRAEVVEAREEFRSIRPDIRDGDVVMMLPRELPAGEFGGRDPWGIRDALDRQVEATLAENEALKAELAKVTAELVLVTGRDVVLQRFDEQGPDINGHDNAGGMLAPTDTLEGDREMLARVEVHTDVPVAGGVAIITDDEKAEANEAEALAAPAPAKPTRKRK